MDAIDEILMRIETMEYHIVTMQKYVKALKDDAYEIKNKSILCEENHIVVNEKTGEVILPAKKGE